MSSVTPRLTRLCCGTSFLNANRTIDHSPTLARTSSALAVHPASSLSTTSHRYLPTNYVLNACKGDVITGSVSCSLKSSFHTSVLGQMGNPRTLIYDLVPQEPRKPEEWQFRNVRYGKSKKEWRPLIPMGIPDLDAIPEGHVDRAENPYTTEPLPWNYTRGIDPATKHISNYAVDEGARRFYRMLDYTRNVPAGENSPFVERVLEVLEDETRNPFIALVVNGNHKRYILASENMKPGDLIKTYNEIPRNPVQAFEGDAYPIGALGVGTIVHNLEKVPGIGGEMATMAGSHGTILRKEGDRVIVSLYRKKRKSAIIHNKEVSVDERCMATVGRVSNINYHLIPIGSPNMLYKLGYKARSGLWQKKDGRFGRRIRPPPPVEEIEEQDRPYTPVYKEK